MTVQLDRRAIHAGVFPFAPLQRILERRFPEIVTIDRNGHPTRLAAGDQTRSADVLRVARNTVNRWANGQLLTIAAADRCATRLDRHPAEIWADFDEQCARLEATVAANHRNRATRTAAKLKTAAA